MIRLIRIMAVAVIVAVVAVSIPVVFVAYDYLQFERQPVLEDGESEQLHIPENTNWQDVAARVADAGLVDSELYFDLWGRKTGLAEEVRAGNFALEGPLGLEEFADLLRQGGRADEVTVTLREGRTKFHFADRLADAGLVDRDAFLEVTRNPERYDWLPEETETLEGYLFPETYRFEQDVSEEAIVDRLVNQWRRVVEPLFDQHAEALVELEEEYDIDRHGIVNMASLIERETGVDDERDVISRVFYNRIERGMRLQTDPTCVYGESTYDLRPTPEHCHDEYNRYSTYVIDGLPPGPIANPGLSSLKAALLPSDDPDVQEYLFFVSRRDGTGRHYFTTNYADHRRAINQYLR